MERVKISEGIKEILRTYSVPEEVIDMVEEGNNLRIQKVADFYEKQIQEMGNKQNKIRKEQSPVEFMEILNKHRIIDK